MKRFSLLDRLFLLVLPAPVAGASGSCGSRCDVVRVAEGLRRCASNVASSMFHFGEAICQMSLAKSCRYLS